MVAASGLKDKWSQAGWHAELGGEFFSSHACGVLAMAEKVRREGQETT
jgi:hypothetical protein